MSSQEKESIVSVLNPKKGDKLLYFPDGRDVGEMGGVSKSDGNVLGGPFPATVESSHFPFRRRVDVVVTDKDKNTHHRELVKLIDADAPPPTIGKIQERHCRPLPVTPTE